MTAGNERRFDALAPVVAAAAIGRTDALRAALGACARAGCTHAEVREALLMLCLFAGFPRTLDAFSIAAAEGVLPPAAPAEPPMPLDQRRERGERLFADVYGEKHGRVRRDLSQLDADLPEWIIEDAYGKVLSRPGLAAAERERLAVVALCALSLPRQLIGHVRGAIHCGASTAELRRSLAAAADLIPAGIRETAEAELDRLEAAGADAAGS